MPDDSNIIPAGMLPGWQKGELPESPAMGWRHWLQMLGPGVLLAGASIGSGEWLFGAAVSAQYGATLLWLASLSVVLQVFYNVEVMRYALYCGEPVVVGFFRTWPGPGAWTVVYLILDFSSIWPLNASNAAVPLAAALLGHLPGEGSVHILVVTLTEGQFVKFLGYVIFFTAFIPLIFGGTIYKMLERIMLAKLLIVLAYLVFVVAFMISGVHVREVAAGFFGFGTVPLRAETVIAGRHFTLTEMEDSTAYTVKGTLENGSPIVIAFIVNRAGVVQNYDLGDAVPAEFLHHRNRLVSRAQAITERKGFFVERIDAGTVLTVEGWIGPDGLWIPKHFSISEDGQKRIYHRLEDIPQPHADRIQGLVVNHGVELANLLGYWFKNRRLPDLDWAMLAAFAAIAGAGGMTNTMFSNYARDKGWGMGSQVGAIASAVGGGQVKLSHVGKVFPLNAIMRRRWRGWMLFMVRDQVAIWMFCALIGMALPCMLSLEFIRHAPVFGYRVAAMTADGMAERYPQYAQPLWLLTLLVGFLILAPGQIMAADQVARRWTDILWTCNARTRKLGENQVKYVYYLILALYGVWGLIALALFNPLQIAKISGVLMNIALGFTSFHTLYVNRTILPGELQPGWFSQAGTLICGIFFLGIGAVVFSSLF